MLISSATLATVACNLEHVSNPLYAELLSFQQIVHVAIQKGCQKVMFETYNMVLMQAIVSDEYDLKTLGTLFKEVKFLIHVVLSVISVVQCKCEYNVAPRTLAVHGIYMKVGCSEANFPSMYQIL